MLVQKLVIDSSSRNTYRFPDTWDFEVDVSDLNLEDVTEIRLTHASIPFPEPHVTHGRNTLYLRTAGGDKQCALTYGRYKDVKQLAAMLTDSLRRDIDPGFTVLATDVGNLLIASESPFTIRTVEDALSRHADGFMTQRPLPNSAATVLGLERTLVAGTPVDGRYFVSGKDLPLDIDSDSVAIVKLANVCSIRSSSQPFDRSFAVLHNGSCSDTLPTTHVNNPPQASLKKFRVSVLRRDGAFFDTCRKNVTLHLDLIKVKPYR